MSERRRKFDREKDVTSRYLAGDFEEDRVEQQERFSQRSKHAQQNKMVETVLMRAEEEADNRDLERLPVGQVVQVHSLFSKVQHEGRTHLCVARRTLIRTLESPIVVGDYVRFRDVGAVDEEGEEEAVIEQVLPRRTVLTRSDSFKAIEQQPIVANAEQMLIVASIRQPRIKWGLVDRMLVAAQSGRLQPIFCLNKIDLIGKDERSQEEMAEAQGVLDHYASMGVPVVQTSVEQGVGLNMVREILRRRVTVLAGHSGVGKSSVIRALQPALDIRIGAISGYTEKGRHTTTSARRYDLDFGGQVIDTPGVKLFGLWGVTADNLIEYFPDVAEETAPEWRQESYQRILESLG